MAEPDEPPADGELPLPPRPAAEVLVPPLPASELRREWQRLEAERESAQHALGGQVVEMAREGALQPGSCWPTAPPPCARARIRSTRSRPPSAGRRRAARPPPGRGARPMLAALIAVGIAGAVAGAFIERRHDDTTAAPVTAYSVVTRDARGAAAGGGHRHRSQRLVTTRVKVVAVRARGGHAVARRQLSSRDVTNSSPR